MVSFKYFSWNVADIPSGIAGFCRILAPIKPNAPVWWCVPLWTKCIPGFQTLQVKLQQRNGKSDTERAPAATKARVKLPWFLQCSILSSSWKSWLVFVFMIDSLALMSAKGIRRWETLVWPHIQRAETLTQAEQPMLLLQAFQFFGHKRLYLLDVHPLALLQEEQQRDVSRLSVTTATTTHKSPHIIGGLQSPGLLTQVAKDVGEMLISDLVEDLSGSSDVNLAWNGSAAIVAESPPYPESSAALWCSAPMRLHRGQTPHNLQKTTR